MSGERKSETVETDILVVGAGPAALLFAIKALGKGYSVTLVHKHEIASGVRKQRVSLDSATVKLLQNFDKNNPPPDLKFFEKLGKRNTVSINSVEKYLLGKLPRDSNQQLQLIQGELDSVDLSKNQVIASGKTIKYSSHLVDASGTARALFKKLDLPAEQKVSKTEMPLTYQPVHKANGTALLVLDEKVTKEFSKIEIMNLKHIPLSEFKKLGWDKDYYPKIYLMPYKSKNGPQKIYLAGEVPSIFLESKSTETDTAKWFKEIMHLYHKIDAENVKMRTYEKESESKELGLRTTTFPLRLSRVKEPIRLISKPNESKQYAFTIGDATQTPQFHDRHGMTDALTGANVAANALPEKKSQNTFNAQQYREFVFDKNMEHQSRLKKMYKERLKGELPVKLNILEKLETQIFELERAGHRPEDRYLLYNMLNEWDEQKPDSSLAQRYAPYFSNASVELKDEKKESKTATTVSHSKINAKLSATPTSENIEKALWLKLNLCQLLSEYHFLTARPILGRTHEKQENYIIENLILNPNIGFSDMVKHLENIFAHMLIERFGAKEPLKLNDIQSRLNIYLQEEGKHNFFRILSVLLNNIYEFHEPKIFPKSVAYAVQLNGAEKYNIADFPKKAELKVDTSISVETKKDNTVVEQPPSPQTPVATPKRLSS